MAGVPGIMKKEADKHNKTIPGSPSVYDPPPEKMHFSKIFISLGE